MAAAPPPPALTPEEEAASQTDPMSGAVIRPPSGTWNPAPVLKQILETPVPGIPPVWQSSSGQGNTPEARLLGTWNPVPLVGQLLGQKTEPAEKGGTAPQIPGAVLVKSADTAAQKPASSSAPEIPGAVLVKPADTPTKETKETVAPAPQIPGATLVPETQPQAQQPQPTQPEQPQTQPQPAAATYPVIAEDQPDTQAQISQLVQQGHSPGAAQARAAGQQPKTLKGTTPAPKLTPPIPQQQAPEPTDTLKAGADNAVDPRALYSYLLGKFANSGLVGYIPPDGARWGIKTGSAAEWAAFGLAVAKQESDLNTRSYNEVDPGGSAGLFQFGQGQKPYVQGDQFDPQQSADAFVRAVQHFLANKGSIANLGATFGSIRRPDEAGQYIAGAQKVAAGGSGKDLVSSGRPSVASGGPPVPQPVWSLPTGAPAGAPSQSPQPKTPSFGGGGGATPSEAPEGGHGGAIFVPLPSFGGGGGQASGGGAAPQPQPSAPAPEAESPVNALMKLANMYGGGPAAPPPIKQANVLGVTTVGGPPPAPGLPSAPQAQLGAGPKALPAPPAAPAPDPLVIKGLMKRGFTREQAIAFAAKATVSKPGAPAQLPAPKPAKAPPPPAPSATLGTGTISQAQRLPQAKPPPPPPPSQHQPPAQFEAASHNMRPLGYRAAVRLTNGEVFSGPEHAHALDNAAENGSIRVNDKTTQYGFVDKKNNFISMEDADRLLEKHWYEQRGLTPPQQPAKQPSPEPTPFGPPKGSTFAVPNPPGSEALEGLPLAQAAKVHAGLLSDDDPRVKKQKDGKIKGEHFVGGDPYHEQLLSGLPYGKQGRQGQIIAQTEQAIGEKTPMHISYISAPAEAELYPTRESRTVQYEAHSPEARLMGTTEGQLVGHSMIPISVGITPSKKTTEPHESYIQGISTNVLANNFGHINRKLAEMGRSTPYAKMDAKFINALEGYLSNLNAGHTGTGRAHAVGTAEYPNSPDENHVPYHLTRLESDFINAVINNTAAFAKHEDGQALRRLAEANGTLITPEGETNRLLHEIEQHDPGWSGRGSGKRGRVLEPSIRTFKTGLIHEIHPSEEHMPATIRPGKEYQDLTKAIQRTSERGRPDVGLATSPRSQPIAGLRRDLAHNAKINEIERQFSEDKITEEQARRHLHAIGENPDEYRFVGGSGGLITPYEEDPEAITHEEHASMKDNLRKQWVGGKLNVEDYRRKVAEVPLPSKPSPKPVATSPAPPVETPETPAPAPKPAPPSPKPKPAPKPPPEPAAEPEKAPEETAPAKPKPPAPDEPLPATPLAKAKGPPAPDEPLPPVVKKAAPTPAAAPKKLPKLVKPKDANGEWKGVPEADKQAYLEEKVKRTLANQIRDKATHELKIQRNENGGIKYDPNGAPIYEQHDYDIANSPMLKKKALNQIKGADEHEDTLGNLIGPDGKEVIDPETGKAVLKHAHLNQVERRRLSAMHTTSSVHTMGDKIFDSYMSVKDHPEIAAGEGWYSRMRKRLADALGEHHELFAQLLGATSAKTPVRTNFINSLDAFEQYKEGLKDPTNMNLGFNRHINKFLEAYDHLQSGEGALTQHMRDLGILKPEEADHKSDAAAMAHWIDHHDILPRGKTGNKYSANSEAVLKVLAGKWLKDVGAPKTPNFAGNLTGRTLEATIDVWAARHLQRLGYEGYTKGPWRAQSAAEPGVSNLDFAFSQDAMRHAADRISRETGKKMNPDDLQAILWFAEKHHYEGRGWTRGQGAEKSSFDEVADKVFGKDGQPHDRPMDSQQLRAHYQAEAKALQQRKGKIETAQGYLGTPKEQTHLPAYMQKHGLTHQEVHGAGDEGEEAA